MKKHDSFNSYQTLQVGSQTYGYHALQALEQAELCKLSELPYAIRVLLENLLRGEDGESVTRDVIAAAAGWRASGVPALEVPFRPARVLLQDFTGVPCVVDLATMRERVAELGGSPDQVNPLQPVDLVIDHSVQVDDYASPLSLRRNTDLEFKRNAERYNFLRWGQKAFQDFRTVPPGTGIVHQVNIEYLAQVVVPREQAGALLAYPDTLVGTDSHTTMVNGLGVLGWGVGGIEAEAAMLGQPVAMLLPEVVGFELTGKLPEGANATDLVLTCTQMLRKYGVVGKFVEFYGDGVANLSLPDRATIANMAPEYGATAGFFPVDEQTLRYLRFTGRTAAQVQLVEAYCRAQGLFMGIGDPAPSYSGHLRLDMSTVEASLAGPRRPQDRFALREAKESYRAGAEQSLQERLATEAGKRHPVEGGAFDLGHGDVVIAAITSCTNTSNPAVLLGAGLVAKKAVERGLTTRPWVKTSLAPGSQVVTEYLTQAGLMEPLQALGFHLVGYGCTTCIGNSGPLKPAISEVIRDHKLYVASVLSGNRNFEGRINQDVQANFLASPPLVVAYALAGTMNIDLYNEPVATAPDGSPVMLSELWPSSAEVGELIGRNVSPKMFEERYADVFTGPEAWQAMSVQDRPTFAWDAKSTYVRKAPFFDQVKAGEPPQVKDVEQARCLVMVGDSVTTDHISPAGSIATDSPAAKYLMDQGVEPMDFNSYGSRRGNHEVMVRGTFANIRLRNQLAPGTEGGVTRHFPSGEPMSIFDAAERYRAEGVPLLVLAGKEYGTGSSRDWAAKGTLLLGVRAVIAESYERIHRSNLVGMGVLPLQFQEGQSAASLGLTGQERFEIRDLAAQLEPGAVLTVVADDTRFQVRLRLDGAQEVAYYKHGGILNYVLRQLVA